MDVHFKPYGKASHKTSSKELSGYTFDCQHGPTECLGNMIHACAIKHVSNQGDLVSLIGCMIKDNMNPKVAGESCSNELNIDWQNILKCTESTEGGELLAMHGDDTNSLKPKVSFIPTVLLNGSQDRQKELLKKLQREICMAFKGSEKPKACDA